MSAISRKYFVQTSSIETKPGCWNHLLCTVLQRQKGKKTVKVGEYKRNYWSFYNTFEPFIKDGKEYALISTNYLATAVISLPDCKIIASEELSPHGFCPTGFHVPMIGNKELEGQMGLVSGCVWGDDSSWKVQYLDLSQIEKGIIKRDERFGYIELIENRGLAKSVRVYCYYDENKRMRVGASILAWKEYDIDLKTKANIEQSLPPSKP